VLANIVVERTATRHSTNWIFRPIYDLARLSTVVTKTMNTRKTSFATTERHEGAAFKAAAALASPGPLGVITMGTFPPSLIALGWSRRLNLDHSLDSRAKSDQWRADFKRGNEPSLS
jgi:hypothetical protein